MPRFRALVVVAIEILHPMEILLAYQALHVIFFLDTVAIDVENAIAGLAQDVNTGLTRICERFRSQHRKIRGKRVMDLRC